MSENRVYSMKFSEMYKLYVAKAEKKGRSSDEVNKIICWLTGYTMEDINQKTNGDMDMENFFTSAPLPNPNRVLITGSICGVKISELEESTMKEIRYLDKLVDELAKGKTMKKILRK